MNVKNVALLMIMSYGVSCFASENQRIVEEQNYIIEAQKSNLEAKRDIVRVCLSQVIAQQGTWMACDAMKNFNDVDGFVHRRVQELWGQNVRYSYLIAQDRTINLPWMIAFTPEDELLAYNSRPKHLGAPCAMEDPESYIVEKA